ncbi:kelch repeat and BTB domain-containing protein 12-like isoform X1 [Branchiostoma floridae x Branchiostoma japonicum]
MAATETERNGSTIRPRFYQDGSYLHGFLGTVGDLQKEGAFQDVIFEVENQQFPCHRLVLSAASPYFRAMFTSGMVESRQKTVVLQGLDSGIFKEIMSYIYSGTLHVFLDKVQPLYQAADLLQLDYVRDTCSSYMAMNVERANCLDLYNFADAFCIDIVMRKCLQWIDRNFAEFSFSDDFFSLSVHQLTEIIRHDELNVTEETTVWEAVVRWVQHSREDRLHHLPKILPHIRFNRLTSDLTKAILEHPLVREDPESCDVIRNLIRKRKFNLEPRLGITMEMVLLSNMDVGSNEILFMNPQEEKYISCGYDELPGTSPLTRAMTVTSDNDIYILDTKELKNKNVLSLFMYYHAENVWEHVSRFTMSKGPGDSLNSCYQLLLEIDRILYYIIADRHGTGLAWMRKYNQQTDRWQECSQLQLDDTAYFFSVVSCGPHLYFLTSTEVHRYNPSQDQWSKRTPPIIMDEVCAAVAIGTEIFCTDHDFTKTMLYDTKSDCWQRLQGWPRSLFPSHSVMDLYLSLFALDNQLHILLSYNSDFEKEEDLYLVYVYDRAAGAWRDLKGTLPGKSYIVHASHCSVARISLPYLEGE